MRKSSLYIIVLSLLISLSSSSAMAARECYSDYIKDVSIGHINYDGVFAERVSVTLDSDHTIVSSDKLASVTGGLFNMLIEAQERNKLVSFESPTDDCKVFNVIFLKDKDDI